jgi:hypothetical protein
MASLVRGRKPREKRIAVERCLTEADVSLWQQAAVRGCARTAFFAAASNGQPSSGRSVSGKLRSTAACARIYGFVALAVLIPASSVAGAEFLVRKSV